MKNANGYFQIVIFWAILILPGCNNETPVKSSGLPGVTTILVSKIFERSAQSGGDVTAEGGSPVTARGICWSVLPEPTISGDRDDEGTGTGKFQAFLFGLTGSTVYYVRAFATNGMGTGYGEEVMFKTQASPPPVLTGTVSDLQGNIYRTKKIGTQTWMTENLTAKIFQDGSGIPFVRGSTWYSLTTPAFCWVEDNDSRTIVYGMLYNFYAVTDPRNVCPTGWHVPSVDEWKAMITSLGGNDVAGGEMKETGTAHWSIPNEGASNSSGFTGLPAGIRDQLSFMNFDISGYFWSATSLDSDFGQIQALRYSSDDLFSDQYPKTAGASVRCVEN